MRDLGLNPRRKKTVFEEWFVPYRPQDYRGLLQEYLSAHSRRIPEGMTAHKAEEKMVMSKKANGQHNKE